MLKFLVSLSHFTVLNSELMYNPQVVGSNLRRKCESFSCRRALQLLIQVQLRRKGTNSNTNSFIHSLEQLTEFRTATSITSSNHHAVKEVLSRINARNSVDAKIQVQVHSSIKVRDSPSTGSLWTSNPLTIENLSDGHNQEVFDKNTQFNDSSIDSRNDENDSPIASEALAMEGISYRIDPLTKTTNTDAINQFPSDFSDHSSNTCIKMGCDVEDHSQHDAQDVKIPISKLVLKEVLHVDSIPMTTEKHHVQQSVDPIFDVDQDFEEDSEDYSDDKEMSDDNYTYNKVEEEEDDYNQKNEQLTSSLKTNDNSCSNSSSSNSDCEKTSDVAAEKTPKRAWWMAPSSSKSQTEKSCTSSVVDHRTTPGWQIDSKDDISRLLLQKFELRTKDVDNLRQIMEIKGAQDSCTQQSIDNLRQMTEIKGAQDSCTQQSIDNLRQMTETKRAQDICTQQSIDNLRQITEIKRAQDSRTPQSMLSIHDDNSSIEKASSNPDLMHSADESASKTQKKAWWMP